MHLSYGQCAHQRVDPLDPHGHSTCFVSLRRSMPAKKPNDQIRSTVVRVRLTPGELDALSSSADAHGVSISLLVRHLALGAVIPKTPPAKVDQDTYLALGKIGNNLNQIARRMNSLNELVPEADEIKGSLATLERTLKLIRLEVLR